MAQFEISGFYGSSKTPCTVLVYEECNGFSRWYCVEGSDIVNLTYDDIEDGVDVEDLSDLDCFTWGIEINTLYQLEVAVNC
jgi:hypothetical protein